jgi:cobalt-zinc-cadmium efflux system outer membrane protein
LIWLPLLSGCAYFWSSQIDKEVEDMSALVGRVEIRPAIDEAPRTEKAEPSKVSSAPNSPSVEQSAARTNRAVPLKGDAPPTPDKKSPAGPIQPIAFREQEKKPPERLTIPPGLPGADAPAIPEVPRDPEQKKKFLQKVFPNLEPAPQLSPLAPGPEGRQMTLADLQRFAATYSPAIKSAEAAVEAAKGAVKQAGAYPNPSVFFEQDTVGTGPGGYEGFGFNQVVKTANKLKLQQAAAMMDLLNAQLALKKAYSDLAYQVRTNYFAVLVALEGVKSNEALFKFTNESYRVQVDMVEGQLSAPYEAMQLRALAIQARFNLVQSQNQYLASWKQLAATLGLRDMPPTELSGQVDMPVPFFEYNEVLRRVLASHTDLLTAFNNIQKARFNLKLAQVTPVPDVTLNVLVQKDYTAPPNQIVHSLQFGIPVPVFDQNQGNIKQAEGMLAQANAGPDQTRNTLTISLADAFNRYETARYNVEIALQQCRDQIRAYSRLRARRGSDPTAVSFGDIVTAQQTLAGYVAAYVAALGSQWTAVNDVANLLQTDDLFQAGPRQQMAPVPTLNELPLPRGFLPRLPAPLRREELP